MDDRHARRRRRPTDPRRRPTEGFRAPDARGFDRLVAEALRTTPGPIRTHLGGVEVHIADLPPASTAAPEVPLARYQPRPGGAGDRGDGATADRLVLFRRPLEARAQNRTELVLLLREVVVHEIAHHLGIDDDGIEELGWD